MPNLVRITSPLSRVIKNSFYALSGAPDKQPILDAAVKQLNTYARKGILNKQNVGIFVRASFGEVVKTGNKEVDAALTEISAICETLRQNRARACMRDITESLTSVLAVMFVQEKSSPRSITMASNSSAKNLPISITVVSIRSKDLWIRSRDL